MSDYLKAAGRREPWRADSAEAARIELASIRMVAASKRVKEAAELMLWIEAAEAMYD